MSTRNRSSNIHGLKRSASAITTSYSLGRDKEDLLRTVKRIRGLQSADAQAITDPFAELVGVRVAYTDGVFAVLSAVS